MFFTLSLPDRAHGFVEKTGVEIFPRIFAKGMRQPVSSSVKSMIQRAPIHGTSNSQRPSEG
jgi:hypothetical protein